MDLSKYKTQPNEIMVELIGLGNYTTESGLIVQQDQNDYMKQKSFECVVLKVGDGLKDRVSVGDHVIRRYSTGKKLILPGVGNYILLNSREIDLVIRKQT